jgi:hypothetical protein
VTIVVEGGPDTLLAIYNDLRKDIPVVLIDVSHAIIGMCGVGKLLPHIPMLLMLYFVFNRILFI